MSVTIQLGLLKLTEQLSIVPARHVASVFVLVLVHV